MGKLHATGTNVSRKWVEVITAALVLTTTVSRAGPEGAQVIHGSAQFNQTGNYTTIQASDKAIINYSRFDIARPETVQFIQPNANASVLNRIFSANPTTIDGTLLANGRVFFVNPAGVIFGESAQVNATQLVASAFDIGNADFISGNLLFAGGQGHVVNMGNIHAEKAYLIGKQVANSGTIDCPGGYTVMASGDRVLIQEVGTDLLVDVSALAPSPAEGAATPTPGAAVANEGTVQVGNGTIILAAAGDVYSQAISNVGKLSASVAAGQAGQVKLQAPDGKVLTSGTIEARSDSGTGGTVHVLGDRVGLVDRAAIDVSGSNGGGTVLVGGDYQGKGETPTASRTYVGPNTAIKADATQDGDGGKVIVWSDEITRFYGKMSARGGATSGDGGFAEVSGKQNLDFSGVVDMLAPQGEIGTLLLDPVDIEVVTVGGVEPYANVSTFGAVPSAEPAKIAPATLDAVGASVDLQAQNSITVTDAITLTTPAAGLTARAGGNITLNNSITTNGGPISLIANDAGGIPTGNGSITGGGALTTKGSDATNAAGGAVTLSVAAGTGSITVGAIDARGGGTNAETAGGAGGAVSISTVDGAITTGTINSSGGNAGDATGPGDAYFGGNAGGVTLQVTGATSARAISVGAVTATGGTGSMSTAPHGPGGAGGTGGPISITADVGDFGASLATSTITAGGGAGGAAVGNHAGGAGGAGGSITIQVVQGVNHGGAITTVGGTGGDGTATGTAGDGGAGGTVSVTSVAGAVSLAAITTTGGTAGATNGGIAGTAGAGAGIIALADTLLTAGGAIAAGGGSVTFTSNSDATISNDINAGADTIGLLFGQGGSGGTLDLSASGTLTGSTVTAAGGAGTDTLIGTGKTYTLDDAVANKGTDGTVTWTTVENLTDTGAGLFNMGTGGSVAANISAVGGTVNYATRAGAATFSLGGGASTGMEGWTGITTVTGSGNSDTITGTGRTYTLDHAVANKGSDGTVTWTSFENLADSGAGVFHMGTAGSVTGSLSAVGGTVSYATRTGAATFDLGGGASTGMGGWTGIATVTGGGDSDTITGAGRTYTLDNAVADKGSDGTISWTSFENLTDSGAGLFNMGAGGSVAGNLTASGGTLDYGNYASGVAVVLTGANAGTVSVGIGGSFGGVSTINANVLQSNTLTGSGGNESFTISGAGSGSVLGITYTGFTTLGGGGGSDTLMASGGADTFAVSGAGAGSVGGNTYSGFETLDGGLGSDTLDLTGLAATTVTLSGANAGSEATVGAFNEIEILEATPGSTLIGTGLADTFTTGGADAGTVQGIAYDGFANLDGAAGDDRFDVSHDITGTVTGGAGTDTFNYTGGMIGALTGGADSDTIVGPAGGATWVTTAPDAGTVAGQAFSSMENWTGGAGADTFTLGHSITGAVTGGAGADTFNYGAGTIGALTGGADNDTIAGPAGGAAWVATAPNTGTVAGQTFSSMENWTGGAGADVFTLADAGSLTGAIAGGGGVDTLTGDDDGNAFVVTGPGAGTLAGKTSGWSQIESLTGGSGADAFTLADAGSLTGTIAGGGGVDTLTGDDDGNAFVITGPDAGTLTGKTSGWSQIESLAGGTGTDTLTAANGANTWMLTGANRGTVTGLTGGFTSMENLVGGANTDAFHFNAGVTWNGALNGGAGMDTLDLSSLATGQIVMLTALGGTDGFNGTVAAVTGGFSNINTLTGTTETDTLTGMNTAGTWSIGAANSGTYTGTNSLDFASFENLTGGTNADVFDLGAGLTWVGALTLNGNGGTDVINILNGVTVGDALSATAETINLGGAISAGATQTYVGPVVLLADAPLTGTGVTFSGTVDGARDLTLVVSGATTFGGTVGGTTPLGDGTGASLTIQSPGTTEFAQPVRTSQGISQADGAGAVMFQENVDVLGSGTPTQFDGNVVLDGMTFTSAGPMTFGNAGTDRVTLSGGPVKIDTIGALTMNATVDGRQKLTVKTGTAGAAFGGPIGTSTPLAGFEVTAGGDITMQSVEANGNIVVRSTGGDLLINDRLNAHANTEMAGGGVSLVSDVGEIYTPGHDTGGQHSLDVPITGYSDHNRSLGVDLDTRANPTPIDPKPGKAAIVIASGESLALGTDAVLTANGVYHSGPSSLVDDRDAIVFETAGANAGQRLDVAIYLWAGKTQYKWPDSGTPPLPSFSAHPDSPEYQDVAIDVGGISINNANGTGTFVVDAVDMVTFTEGFERYLRDVGGLQRIEAASRITQTLDQAALWHTLPHAENPDEVIGVWKGFEGGASYQTYLLRGPKMALAQPAAELGRANNAPFTAPVAFEVEQPSALVTDPSEAIETAERLVGCPLTVRSLHPDSTKQEVETQAKYRTIGSLIATDWTPDEVRRSVAKRIIELRDDLTRALESQDPRDLPVLTKLSGLVQVWPEPDSENITQIQMSIQIDHALGKWMRDSVEYVRIVRFFGTSPCEPVERFLSTYLEPRMGKGVDSTMLDFMASYLAQVQ